MQLSWTSVCNRSVSAPGRNLSNNMLCFLLLFFSIKHTYIPSVHFFFDLSLHPFCDYNHVIIFYFFKIPPKPNLLIKLPLCRVWHKNKQTKNPTLLRHSTNFKILTSVLKSPTNFPQLHSHDYPPSVCKTACVYLCIIVTNYCCCKTLFWLKPCVEDGHCTFEIPFIIIIIKKK